MALSTEFWNTLEQLPEDAFNILHSQGIPPPVIVATVDQDGSPHTAPFGSLCALTRNKVRFACDRRHDTYANIVRDGRVTVCLIAPKNVAISIKGRARVVKKQMDLVVTDAIIEVVVEQVKNDYVRGTRIDAPITYSVPEHLRDYVASYVAEVREPGVR